MKVGITSPGSSSDFFLQYYLSQHAIAKNDVSIIGVGSGSAAVAALQHRQHRSARQLRPGRHHPVDKRHRQDPHRCAHARGREVGLRIGIYPTSVLVCNPTSYVKTHPEIVQKVVNAEVKALKYIQAHTAKDIVAHLPKTFVSGNRDTYIKAVGNAKQIFSPDGEFDPATTSRPR